MALLSEGGRSVHRPGHSGRAHSVETLVAEGVLLRLPLLARVPVEGGRRALCPDRLVNGERLVGVATVSVTLGHLRQLERGG